MQAQAKMAHAMGSTAKVMAATNKQMKLEDIQKTMANFDKESTKMDLAGEMSEGAIYYINFMYILSILDWHPCGCHIMIT